MAKVYSLEVFRRDRDRERAEISDDGTDVQRTARSSVKPLLSTVAAPEFFAASASEQVPGGSSVLWRSLVNETICRLKWDYEEMIARLSRAGGPVASFAERRSTLEPAIDGVYALFPPPPNGSRDSSATLSPSQCQKIEQLQRDLSKLISDISAALQQPQQRA